MGCTPALAGSKLRLVKVTGLIVGSAQAGYRLAGPMLHPEDSSYAGTPAALRARAKGQRMTS
jgi:hypothetical protein